MLSGPIAMWHRLVEKRDTRGLDALLADEAVFYSPVVHTPQVGKAITKKYLVAAFHVFFNESFRYVRELRGNRDAILEFEVKFTRRWGKPFKRAGRTASEILAMAKGP